MADLAHLEKMGRELKCPICLSLLKSAVSLPCNHVFCNLCVLESMKSVSDCPICKVPFRRREVRPAPHMDNLVTVFKSMEAAAGVNIFTTQVGPTTKNQGEVEKISTEETALTRRGKSNKKGSIRKTREKLEQTQVTKSDSSKQPMPSFPAKKRVHVTPYPISETPVRPRKVSKHANACNEVEITKPMNEDTLFSPFFWLREGNDDEDDEASGKASGQPITDTSQANIAPCFSDIKDSENDKSPIKATAASQFNVEEAFDSEMFEWTQRACSPELFSTPLKKRAEGTNKLDAIQQKDCPKQTQMASDYEETVKNQMNKTLVAKKGSDKENKRPSRTRGKHFKKCTNTANGSSLDKIHSEVQVNSKDIVKDSIEEDEEDEERQIQSRTRKTTMKDKKPISSKQKTQNQESEVLGILLPVLNDNTPKSEMGQNVLDKTKKRRKQTTIPSKNKCLKLSMDAAATNVSDEVNVNVVTEASPQDQEHQYAVKVNQSNSLTSKSLSTIKHVSSGNGDKILKKCGNPHSQIICAFCQSSNDTVDSGEMMHFFNGKPVAADYNEGVNVIHAHKCCTEWAPDVYFEDDLAINLGAELARSRRIKCSCCGIKGAALGCYEKSCRKSFHFICAKLVPECRWDNDNFVMLCPLHSSSKLPDEASKPLKQKRKKSISKVEPKASTNCKNSDGMSRMWTWTFGSPCKWVLCCSALADAEKDIMSEFTKLTSVPISKSWNPAITHVIASTDENGACRRTLKVLKGILDGKWILSIEWIKACLKAMEPVEEGKFEITVDVHGISGGPQLGRLRAMNKEQKLFYNLRFYLAGDFTPSYKGYLQDLIIAAGGTVLKRKPLTNDQEKLFNNSLMLKTFIIYSLELKKQKCSNGLDITSRRNEAQSLASVSGAKVATSSWIIDSIAASKLQPLS